MANLPIDEKTIISILPPFVGAIVAAIRNQPDMPRSRVQIVTEVFSGFTTAYFTTPVIADFFNLTNKGNHWVSALGFVVGMIGLSIIPIIINAGVAITKTYISEYGSSSNDKK